MIVPRKARWSLSALFFAEASSILGTEMAAVALPWFVLVTSGSAGQMGAVMAAEFAGIALCGIPSGPLAVRLGPKRTMIVSDIARAVLVALIPALHWSHLLSLPWLLALGFGVGAFFPAYSSSQWLAMARLVNEDEARLTRVGSLFGAVNETGSFAGPALGGLLIAALGAPAVLLIDAVSFLVPALMVAAFVPRTAKPAADEGTQSVAAGLRWLLRDRRLSRRILGVGIQNMGWTAMMATLPVLALTRFDGGSRMAGWFVAAYGAGSVAGGLMASRIKAPTDRTAAVAVCGFALSTWLLLVSWSPWIVGLGVALGGVSFGVFFARFFSTLATRTPAGVRTQVMIAVNTALSVTGPIGFVAAGQLLQHASATASLRLVAISASCGALIVATTFQRSRPS
ncbi:MFS transporter [Kitasatospora sp. NPDC051914]|uniref:MFS transporter n=1 Tax=Kitasatospora sp. NPDC051914 TaxID=3154945 RepID=UPI00342D6D71